MTKDDMSNKNDELIDNAAKNADMPAMPQTWIPELGAVEGKRLNVFWNDRTKSASTLISSAFTPEQV